MLMWRCGAVAVSWSCDPGGEGKDLAETLLRTIKFLLSAINCMRLNEITKEVRIKRPGSATEHLRIALVFWVK